MNGWLVFCRGILRGILPFPEPHEGIQVSSVQHFYPRVYFESSHGWMSRDIQNENIVRKILKGASTMGHISKCFILNTWVHHHKHNRFDLCMKGHILSTSLQLALFTPHLYLFACILLCKYQFTNECRLSKANMEDTCFCFKAVSQYKCCSFQSCISFHPCIRAEDNEVYPKWCSPLLLRTGFLAWWPQNWGLYVPVHVWRDRDRLCVSFHRSSWSVKKVPHCSKSLVWFPEQHLFLHAFCRSTQFEFKGTYWWENIVIAVWFSILKCFKWQ